MTGSDIKKRKKNAERLLGIIYKWEEKNQVEFNEKKMSKGPTGKETESEASVKDLPIIIDEKLNIKEYIDKTQ